MNADQLLLRDGVRRIVARDLGHANDIDTGERIWEDLAASGMTGVGIPEFQGGSGGAFIDAATLVFEVGRAAAPVPLPETILLSPVVLEATGWLWSGGAESVAPIALQPSARVVAKDLVLNGTVPRVPWGRSAKVVHVIVDVGGEPVVARVNPIATRVECAENLAGEPRDTLMFDELHVGPGDWLAVQNLADDVALRGALMRAIAMAGAMTSLLEMTTDYSKGRVQFGRSISKFQAVQQLLARLAGEVQVSVSAARAAVVATQSGAAEFEIAAAAARISSAAIVASRIAHQVHGAIGVTKEYPLHVFTTRLRSWSNEYGNRSTWAKVISRQILGAPEPNVWSLLTKGGA